MKTNILAIMTALLLTSQPWNQAKATVFIDLDLSDHTTNTVKNDGTWGNGTVGLLVSGSIVPGAGTWENVNATGDPAGLAYNTGATASTADGGKIWWNNGTIATTGTLTFYTWIKPSQLMAGGRVFESYNNGTSLNVIIEPVSDHMALKFTINGQSSGNSINFGATESSVLGDLAIDNWLFVGVTYDKTSGVTAFAGLATDDALVNFTNSYMVGDVSLSSQLLTLLDNNYNGSRPFLGSLGDFYLSDEVVDFESIFDSTKYLFIAVPEVSTSLLMLAGGALLLGLLHRQRRRAS
ncbi:MAG: hypothetical protein LBK76_01660 [Verrucomicrobiales bacterium]|jgi:hypothetical protein|nr:hypothetical protein [Verrucomicrobiales bacterium]